MMSLPPSTRRFRAFGTSFGLRGTDREVVFDAIGHARALGWTDANDDAETHVDVEYVFDRRPSHDPHRPWSFDLHCDDALVRRTTDRAELFDAFESHAKIQTALHARDRLFVHAGAISWRGRGIVLPGRSCAGKSTLVKALVEAGAEYYSDEFAVLDVAGRLHPYPLPLSIRASGAEPPARIPGGACDGRVGDGPVPVDLIVMTSYEPGARWRPVPLSPSHALLAPIENTVAARQPPERTMPILRQMVLSARAIHSRRGEAGAAARAVLAELA
jgi:hypothetical protein